MKGIKKKIILIFSLILSVVSIFGTTTSSAFAADAAPEVDKVLVNTYQDENGVICAPTVVVDAVNAETLNKAITAEKKPSNVILRVDDNCNVVSKDGANINTFTEVYTSLNKEIIPILYMSSTAQAEAVINYFTTTKTILDIAVMSADSALVLKVKEYFPSVRGIVEFDGTQTKEEMVVTSQLGKAMVVSIPQSFATVKNVSYLQGMFKTAWVRVDSADAMDIANCVFSGAYGLITEDAAPVYELYSNLPENTYVRSPFIVAHRGDVQNCNSNSLSGIESSYQGGATHIEMDFHVTKDKKVIAMHDTTINGTTNGTGTVANMTLEQIQKYQLDDHATAEPEKIPTFEECVAAILETDLIFVLELKCSGLEIISLVNQILTTNEELTPILDRMVVITFYTDQLAEMNKVMPRVPTANLNNAKQSAFANVLDWMGKYNTGIDTSSSDITPAFQHMLKSRGIIDWSWTYNTFAQTQTAQQKGYIGLTNNQPAMYEEVVKNFYLTEKSFETIPQWGETIAVTVETYGTVYSGLTQTMEGRVMYLSDGLFECTAIAQVEIDGYTYYTQAYTFDKGLRLPLTIGCIAGGVIIVAAVAVILVLVLKKKHSA